MCNLKFVTVIEFICIDLQTQQAICIGSSVGSGRVMTVAVFKKWTGLAAA